jgi:hypothetical protein
LERPQANHNTSPPHRGHAYHGSTRQSAIPGNYTPNGQEQGRGGALRGPHSSLRLNALRLNAIRLNALRPNAQKLGALRLNTPWFNALRLNLCGSALGGSAPCGSALCSSTRCGSAPCGSAPCGSTPYIPLCGSPPPLRLSALQIGSLRVRLNTQQLNALRLNALRLNAVRLYALRLNALRLRALWFNALWLNALRLNALWLGALRLNAPWFNNRVRSRPTETARRPTVCARIDSVPLVSSGRSIVFGNGFGKHFGGLLATGTSCLQRQLLAASSGNSWSPPRVAASCSLSPCARLLRSVALLLGQRNQLCQQHPGFKIGCALRRPRSAARHQ